MHILALAGGGGGGLAAARQAGGSLTATRRALLPSADDAARLHEVLRLAGLNARGAVLTPISHQPLLRTTLFDA